MASGRARDGSRAWGIGSSCRARGAAHVRPIRPGRHGGLSSCPAHRPGRRRFATGARLAGRYRILAALGRGGVAEVYRADDLTLRQSVVRKFLPAELRGTPSGWPGSMLRYVPPDWFPRWCLGTIEHRGGEPA